MGECGAVTCTALNRRSCLELETWSFGDNAEMADRLLLLVLDGKKTATSGLLKDYEQEGIRVPKIGQQFAIQNSAGEAKCVIEIVKVEIKPFLELDERFAASEG